MSPRSLDGVAGEWQTKQRKENNLRKDIMTVVFNKTFG